MTDDRSVAGRIPEAMSMRGLAGKRDYVRSLENRRDEEAMSLLIECLCDESWYLRELAEEAVEEARLAGEGVSALARANFLQALGQICWWHGDPQATVRYCQEALQIAPVDVE